MNITSWFLASDLDKSRSLARSLLEVLAVLCAYLVFVQIPFETGDDTLIVSLLKADALPFATSKMSPLPFMDIPVRLLAPFYSWAPQVPWYSAFIMLALLFSLAVLLDTLVRVVAFTPLARVLLVSLVLLLLFPVISFTRVSIVAALSAFLFLWFSTRKHRVRYTLGLLLLCLSAMLRADAMWLGVILGGGLVFLQNPKAMWVHRSRLGYMVLTILPVAVLGYLHGHLLMTPDQKAFNTYRVQTSDYRSPIYKDVPLSEPEQAIKDLHRFYVYPSISVEPTFWKTYISKQFSYGEISLKSFFSNALFVVKDFLLSTEFYLFWSIWLMGLLFVFPPRTRLRWLALAVLYTVFMLFLLYLFSYKKIEVRVLDPVIFFLGVGGILIAAPLSAPKLSIRMLAVGMLSILVAGCHFTEGWRARSNFEQKLSPILEAADVAPLPANAQVWVQALAIPQMKLFQETRFFPENSNAFYMVGYSPLLNSFEDNMGEPFSIRHLLSSHAYIFTEKGTVFLDAVVNFAKAWHGLTLHYVPIRAGDVTFYKIREIDREIE